MLKSCVSATLAEQYADMHAVDFRRRQSLLISPHHYFVDLQQWDVRLSNYMQGLELLENNAADYFKEQLLSPLNVGDIFTMGMFAERTEDYDLLEGCLSLVLAFPRFIPAISHLIAWMKEDSFAWPQLDKHPLFKALVIYQKAETFPHVLLSDRDIEHLEVNDDYASWLVYALFLQHHHRAQEITTRFLLTGSEMTQIAVLDVLLRCHLPVEEKKKPLLPLICSTSPEVAAKAIWLFTLHTKYSPDEYHSIISPDYIEKRLWLQALGWAGYAADIPLLVEHFDEPEYARVSASAVSMITGSLPEQSGWILREPPALNVLKALNHTQDDHLAWPDKAAFSHWWQQNSGRFDLNEAYLNGQSVKTPLPIFFHGSLALRQLAAERLRYQQPAFRLNTDAPASQQLACLARLIKDS